jgi:hypothetical protein
VFIKSANAKVTMVMFARLMFQALIFVRDFFFRSFTRETVEELITSVKRFCRPSEETPCLKIMPNSEPEHD